MSKRMAGPGESSLGEVGPRRHGGLGQPDQPRPDPRAQPLPPSPTAPAHPLLALNQRIADCRACPRLVEYRERVALEKRAAFRHETYWGRPAPNLLATTPDGRPDGDARLLLVGLAPAAHGANRTGRMFTGDRSGDFIFAALHRAGFANQPTSYHQDDGLRLIDAAISAACHCAPPGNKPTRDELARCLPFLSDTLDALPRLRAILTLGRIGHDAVLTEYLRRGWLRRRADAPFAHGIIHRFPDHPAAPALVGTYHPSQQNTFTGRLTPAMIDAVFSDVRRILER